MFRGRKKSGRIGQQDLVDYSIKMQEAKRRMSIVRDVVKTGRSEFVSRRSSYPVLASSVPDPARRRRPSFIGRSLDERLHPVHPPPTRSLTGEAAHQDMEIAAAKMQALVRGRTSRKNSPQVLRRAARVTPTAEGSEDTQDTVEPGDGSPPVTSLPSSPSRRALRIFRREGAPPPMTPPVHEETMFNGTVSLNG